MDIHKPKAAHSLREFLVEIGTIICGIVIALTLEQAVESAHRRLAVDEARRALDVEIGFNLIGVAFAEAQTNCALARLDELSRWSRSLDQARPLQIVSPVQAQAHLIFHASVWRLAVAGAVSDMPFERRVAYALVYDVSDHITDLQRQQEQDWFELSELARAAKLDAGQRFRAEADIDRLRRFYPLLTMNLRLARRAARDVGVTRPSRVVDPDLAAFMQREKAAICRPLLQAPTTR